MRPREIVLHDKLFLWGRKHIHTGDSHTPVCSEKLTVHLHEYKKSPLRLIFEGGRANHTMPGATDCYEYTIGPDAGLILQKGREEPGNVVTINLNKPQVIAQLIKFYLRNGWNPKADLQPCEVRHAENHLERVWAQDDCFAARSAEKTTPKTSS